MLRQQASHTESVAYSSTSTPTARMETGGGDTRRHCIRGHDRARKPTVWCMYCICFLDQNRALALC